MANSAVIVLDTAAGWWVTQHDPETYHYLIDTTFIAAAALIGLAINFVLLRAAFAPLNGVLRTIHQVAAGDWTARAEARQSDADALVLATAFNAMLDRLEQERFDASARIVRAQEDERRRIALELHDETGQSLTAVSLHAAAIQRGLALVSGSAAAQAREQVVRLQALIERTLTEVQSLSRQLRPPLLDDLGLPAALRWLADDVSQRLRMAVELRIPGGDFAGAPGHDSRLPAEVETALFRIAQESLTNAARHGHARRARISLRQTRTANTLTVVDDGQGFARSTMHHDPSFAWPVRGQGIVGMRERAHLAGGVLLVRSHPHRGCAVRVVIPMPAHPAPAVHAVDTAPRPSGADAPGPSVQAEVERAHAGE